MTTGVSTTCKVINYTNWKVHYAHARREDIAKTMPAEDVTPDSWYFWRTLCGKDLIAHKTDDESIVSCASCVRSFETARRTYAALAGRFGVR